VAFADSICRYDYDWGGDVCCTDPRFRQRTVCSGTAGVNVPLCGTVNQYTDCYKPDDMQCHTSCGFPPPSPPPG
jgi:hypothetical protein